MYKRNLLFLFLFLFAVVYFSFYIFNTVTFNNFFKRVIRTQAYYRYGIKVDIENINISYFHPAITFNKFSIQDKSANDFKYDISTDYIKLKFSLLNLLSGKLYVSDFIFNNANIYLEFKEDLKEENQSTFIEFENLKNKIFNFQIDKISLINSNLKFKYSNTLYSIDNVFFNLKKSLFNSLILDFESSNFKFKEFILNNLKFNIEFNYEDLYLNSLLLNLDDNKLFFRGTLFDLRHLFENKTSDFNLYSNASLNIAYIFKKLFLFNILDEEYAINGSSELSLDIKGSLSRTNFELGDIKSQIYIKDFAYSDIDLLIPNIDLKLSTENDFILIDEIKIYDKKNYTLLNDIKISLKDYFLQGTGKFEDIDLNYFLSLFSISIKSSTDINGTYKISGSLYPKFEIVSLFDLALSDFYILNEIGATKNIKNSLINFENAKLYGFVNFDAKKAFFNDLRIYDKNSELNLKGNVFFTGSTYADLNIYTELLNLNSLKRISTFKVDGKLSTSINLKILKKDEDSVFINGKLKATDLFIEDYYLGVSSSNISFKNNILGFQNVETLINYSKFNSNINFYLYENEKLQIKSTATKAYLEDLYKIFKITDIKSYFPLGVVDFGLDYENTLNKINSKIKLEGKDIYVLNEKINTVKLDLNLENNEFKGSEIILKKEKSYYNMELNGVFNNFEILFKDNILLLKDLYYFKTKGYDINAKLLTRGKINVLENDFKFNLDFQIVDYFLKNKNLGESNLKLEGSINNIILTYDIFNKSFTGNILISDKVKFNSIFRNFNLYSFLSLYNNYAFEDSFIDGEIIFTYDLNKSIFYEFILKDFNINLNYKDFKVYGNNIFINVNKNNTKFGSFTITSQLVDNICNLNFYEKDNLQIINGCLSAGILSILLPFSDINGNIVFDLKINNINNLLLVDGFLFTNELNLSLKDIGNYTLDGRYNFIKSNLIFNNASLDSFNGSLILNGNIDFIDFFNFKASSPKVDLSVDVKNFSLNYLKNISGFWAGTLFLKGAKLPYNLYGELNLFNGEFRKEFESLELSQKTTSNKSSTNIIDMNLELKSRNDFLIKNDLFDGNLVFDIKLLGSENNLVPSGNINILRGKIFYNDHEFRVNSGRIFLYDDNTNSYQIDAEARILDYQVFMNITGQNGEYSINIYSTPSLSETELISLLATGELYNELSTDPSEFKLNIGQGSFLDNLSITRGLREEAGIRINLKKDQKASMPSIGLEKKFTDDLKLKFEKSLDDTINKQEINVQYDINRNTRFRLLLEEDKSDDRQQDSTKAGFDFRFRFEF